MYRPQKLDLKSNFLEVGFLLAKYSYEFKQKVVSEYLKGDIEYKKLAKSIAFHPTKLFVNGIALLPVLALNL